VLVPCLPSVAAGCVHERRMSHSSQLALIAYMTRKASQRKQLFHHCLYLPTWAELRGRLADFLVFGYDPMARASSLFISVPPPVDPNEPTTTRLKRW